MFNGHKGDSDPKGQLLGNNSKGNRENGKGDCITRKGQRSVLKGELLGEGEPNLFVSHIFFLGSAFPTNTKNNFERSKKLNF